MNGALPLALDAATRLASDRHHLGSQLYVSIDGERIADHAIGQARPGQGLTPDTLMRWFCAAKPCVAVGAQRLFDRLGLSDETTVASIVPEFAQGGKEHVTLANLLGHDVGYTEESGERALFASDNRPERVIAEVCATPLRRPDDPRGPVGYSRTNNYVVIGEVIRRLDGRPPGTFLRDELFEPFGMEDTWAALDRGLIESYSPDRMTRNHVSRLRRGRRDLRAISFLDDPDFLAMCVPGSSVWGPAHDLGRFYEEMLRARRGESHLQTRDVATSMTSARSRLRFEVGYGFPLVWGAGFQCLMWPWCGQYVGFDAFGHDGYGAAIAFADPGLGLVVAYVTNAVSDASQEAWRQVVDAVYRDLGHDQSPHDRPGQVPPAFTRRDGTLVGGCQCGTCVVRAFS